MVQKYQENRHRQSASQWYFPIGNLGMGVYLTDKQMQEVYNNVKNDKPLPGPVGRDPRTTIKSFYGPKYLIKTYESERVKVKRK